MLGSTLIGMATDDAYNPIVEIMKEAQDGFRFKQYMNVGMAAKYGSMGSFEHDTGIFYQGGTPVYTLVAMTNGVSQVDDLLAALNLRINKFKKVGE